MTPLLLIVLKITFRANITKVISEGLTREDAHCGFGAGVLEG